VAGSGKRREPAGRRPAPPLPSVSRVDQFRAVHDPGVGDRHGDRSRHPGGRGAGTAGSGRTRRRRGRSGHSCRCLRSAGRAGSRGRRSRHVAGSAAGPWPGRPAGGRRRGPRGTVRRAGPADACRAAGRTRAPPPRRAWSGAPRRTVAAGRSARPGRRPAPGPPLRWRRPRRPPRAVTRRVMAAAGGDSRGNPARDSGGDGRGNPARAPSPAGSWLPPGARRGLSGRAPSARRRASARARARPPSVRRPRGPRPGAAAAVPRVRGAAHRPPWARRGGGWATTRRGLFEGRDVLGHRRLGAAPVRPGMAGPQCLGRHRAEGGRLPSRRCAPAASARPSRTGHTVTGRGQPTGSAGGRSGRKPCARRASQSAL
jgi:hypothetical protein